MLLLILAEVSLHPISANATPAGVEALGGTGTTFATGAALATPDGVAVTSAVGTAAAALPTPATATPAGVASTMAVGSVQVLILLSGIRGVAIASARTPAGSTTADRSSANKNWWLER